MNINPISINYTNINKNPIVSINNSNHYRITTINDVIIQPKNYALVDTGYNIIIDDSLIIEILPDKNISWIDQSIIRHDIFTSSDNGNSIKVWIYNISDSPISILAGNYIALMIFTTYIKTTLNIS
jgi:dUTPase